MRLQNKVALISGGAKGMGAVEAKSSPKRAPRSSSAMFWKPRVSRLKPRLMKQEGNACLYR